MKYYVCAIREQVGDLQYEEKFLVKTPRRNIKTLLKGITKGWRGDCQYDPIYGGYWFDGYLYFPAKIISQVSEDEYKVLSRFMSTL